jgi:hypothetical protein
MHPLTETDMNINLSQTPAQNLVALLNDMNGTTLVEANVTFSDVETLVEQPTNSRVVVAPGDSPAFSGSDYLYYNRISAPVQLGTNESIEISVTEEMTDDSILSAALLQFPLHSTEWVFSALQRPVGSERPGMLMITAKPDSLLYVGSYSFRLVIAA